MELKEKIKDFPSTSGVYLFKDKEGKILYIGKAKDIRKRVSSYFNRSLDNKTQALISKVEDISYITTSSPAQAQLLEASLIKENLPPYNISLKDDKSFPFICITDEYFPRVYICRYKRVKDLKQNLYFGPYTNVKLLRKALKTLRKIFGFRSCKIMPKKACLYGRISLCPCPCEGKIDSAAYRKIIDNIILFLNSKYPYLLDKLTEEMRNLAEAKRFEEAAYIRDQIGAISLLVNPLAESQEWDQLEDLRKLLNLKKVPLRVEAIDISNIKGQESCGSLVSFYKGIPARNNYRRFRIKTVKGVNDYAMLREVVYRRYKRLIQEKKELPDLIIVDGGKAHLNIVKKELIKLNIEIPIVAIAKKEEKIYTEDNELPIKSNSFRSGFNLILRIRDEAHRFALSYHRILRRKKCLGEES
ncbi:MAG: excinuclease ABC subunit UvrC [Candidatus Omnitrophica bacterium]|nr:excinuclease ABC subunit UvrC [Candidatus Omnitrophota bacterium]